MSHYLNELSRSSKPLSVEAEKYWLAEFKEGNPKAREVLLTANLRFVVSEANKYFNKRDKSLAITMSDLIQEGNIGLCIALDRYDHSTGNRLISYAVWWIRQKIGDYIEKKTRLIKPSTKSTEKAYKLRGIECDLYSELGYTPTAEQLAERSGLKEKHIKAIQMETQRLYSIHHTYQDTETEAWQLMPSDEKTDGHFERSDFHQKIREVIDNLPERESKIIKLSFGFDCNPMSLDEIAEVVGVTRERVRQIRVQLLKNLKRKISL